MLKSSQIFKKFKSYTRGSVIRLTTSGSDSQKALSPLSMRQRVLWLSFPVFIELAMQMAIQIVDAFLLSKISDASAGVVGVLSTYFSLVMMIFVSLSQAANIKITYALSTGKAGKAARYRWAVVYMMIVLSLLCALLTSVFGTQLLSGLYSFQREQLKIASEYMSVAAWSFVSQSLALALSGFIRSSGRPYWTLPGSLAGNVVNALLGYSLVSNGKGVHGVAIAAICGHLTMIIWNFLVSEFLIQIRFSHPRKLIHRYVFSILDLFFPIVFEPFSYQSAQVMIGMVVTRLGTEAMAAKNYAHSLYAFCFLWTVSMSQSAQYLVSLELARGNRSSAIHAVKTCLKSSMIASFILALAIAALSSQILRYLTMNDAISKQAQLLLWIAAAAECGRASNIVVGAALKAAGDARYPAWIGSIFMLGMSVPMSALLGLTCGWGIMGVGIALGLDELIRGALNMRRWRIRHAGVSCVNG
jgi:putative MATE family efflux protein